MNAITIILAFTKVEASLVILSLLLVAGIIGFVSALLYFRQKYRDYTKRLESEIGQLKSQAVLLKAEINALQKSLTERNNELEKFTTKIKTLKGAVENSPQVNTNQNRDNLRMISGIGPFIEERLHAMDIHSFKQISNFTKKDIETMSVAIEYFSGRIERDEWIAQAKELALEEAHEAVLDRIRARKTQIYFNRIGIADKLEANDLTLISGIGGWIEKKLNALEIYTFKQIANFTAEDIDVVTEAIEFFPGRIKRDEWVDQAKELLKVEGNKTDLINRIIEKKNAFPEVKPGAANKHQANNLTLIKGVSLWIEERLNLIDIYTFEQISKLTPKDVSTITEILELSSSRIQKDDWIGQAKELVKNKVPML